MSGLLDVLKDGAYIHMRSAREARDTFQYLKRVTRIPYWMHNYIGKQGQSVFSIRDKSYIYLDENGRIDAAAYRPVGMPYLTIDTYHTYGNIEAQNIDVFFE